MEQIEWETSLKPSDWVSAALAYRKAMGDHKKFLIVVWILIGFATILIVFPQMLFLGFSLTICISDGSCSPSELWSPAQLLIFSLIGCAILLFVAHTNLLYRLRIEIVYRRLYLRNKDLKLPARIIANAEEIVVDEKTHKTSFYWKAFENIFETESAFILSPKRNFFLLVTKRDFKNADQMTQFRNVVETATGKLAMIKRR